MSGPVLIIGDDVTLRELLREWLQTVFEGLELRVTCSGSATAVIESCEPVVVLIDVDAVTEKGASVVGATKASAPMAEVVVLTHENYDALRADMAAAGAEACVCESDMRPLLPMIAEWLAGMNNGECVAGMGGL